MRGKPRQVYEARARIAKALAHPSRLLMLDALAEGERCVCELTEMVGADQSTVSKHLSILRGAGIVVSRRAGSQSFYRLKVPCLNGIWECIEAVLKQNLADHKAALEG